MKKIFLRWIIVLSGFYIIGDIIFDFDETRMIRIITSLIAAVFFYSIYLYLNLKKEEKNNK